MSSADEQHNGDERVEDLSLDGDLSLDPDQSEAVKGGAIGGPVQAGNPLYKPPVPGGSHHAP